jgi:hypothetical protein
MVGTAIDPPALQQQSKPATAQHPWLSRGRRSSWSAINNYGNIHLLTMFGQFSSQILLPLWLSVKSLQ